MGWFHTPHILHAARREGSLSSTASVATSATTDRSRGPSNDRSEEPTSARLTFGIVSILGGVGLVIWHLFNLWALQLAFGIYHLAAVYHVFTGILIANIAGYELLRKLVVNRKAVARTFCCGVIWVLSTARSVGRRASYVVLGAAKAVGVIAANCLWHFGSLLMKGAKLTVYAMHRATERVVGFVTGSFKAVISITRTGVRRVIYAVFRTARSIVRFASGILEAMISETRTAVVRTVCTTLRTMGSVALYAAGVLRAVITHYKLP